MEYDPEFPTEEVEDDEVVSEQVVDLAEIPLPAAKKRSKKHAKLNKIPLPDSKHQLSKAYSTEDSPPQEPDTSWSQPTSTQQGPLKFNIAKSNTIKLAADDDNNVFDNLDITKIEPHKPKVVPKKSKLVPLPTGIIMKPADSVMNETKSSSSTELFLPPKSTPEDANSIIDINSINNQTYPYLVPQKLRSAQMISQPLIANPTIASQSQKKTSQDIVASQHVKMTSSPSGKKRSRSRSKSRDNNSEVVKSSSYEKEKINSNTVADTTAVDKIDAASHVADFRENSIMNTDTTNVEILSMESNELPEKDIKKDAHSDDKSSVSSNKWARSSDSEVSHKSDEKKQKKKQRSRSNNRSKLRNGSPNNYKNIRQASRTPPECYRSTTTHRSKQHTEKRNRSPSDDYDNRRDAYNRNRPRFDRRRSRSRNRGYGEHDRYTLTSNNNKHDNYDNRRRSGSRFYSPNNNAERRRDSITPEKYRLPQEKRPRYSPIPPDRYRRSRTPSKRRRSGSRNDRNRPHKYIEGNRRNTSGSPLSHRQYNSSNSKYYNSSNNSRSRFDRYESNSRTTKPGVETAKTSRSNNHRSSNVQADFGIKSKQNVEAWDFETDSSKSTSDKKIDDVDLDADLDSLKSRDDKTNNPEEKELKITLPFTKIGKDSLSVDDRATVSSSNCLFVKSRMDKEDAIVSSTVDEIKVSHVIRNDKIVEGSADEESRQNNERKKKSSKKQKKAKPNLPSDVDSGSEDVDSRRRRMRSGSPKKTYLSKYKSNDDKQQTHQQQITSQNRRSRSPNKHKRRIQSTSSSSSSHSSAKKVIQTKSSYHDSRKNEDSLSSKDRNAYSKVGKSKNRDDSYEKTKIRKMREDATGKTNSRSSSACDKRSSKPKKFKVRSRQSNSVDSYNSQSKSQSDTERLARKTLAMSSVASDSEQRNFAKSRKVHRDGKSVVKNQMIAKESVIEVSSSESDLYNERRKHRKKRSLSSSDDSKGQKKKSQKIKLQKDMEKKSKRHGNADSDVSENSFVKINRSRVRKKDASYSEYSSG